MIFSTYLGGRVVVRCQTEHAVPSQINAPEITREGAERSFSEVLSLELKRFRLYTERLAEIYLSRIQRTFTPPAAASSWLHAHIQIGIPAAYVCPNWNLTCRSGQSNWRTFEPEKSY